MSKKKSEEPVHNEDCSLLPLEVTLIYAHNAVKINDILKETKRMFLELFQKDHSASSAYEEYKN